MRQFKILIMGVIAVCLLMSEIPTWAQKIKISQFFGEWKAADGTILDIHYQGKEPVALINSRDYTFRLQDSTLLIFKGKNNLKYDPKEAVYYLRAKLIANGSQIKLQYLNDGEGTVYTKVGQIEPAPKSVTQVGKPKRLSSFVIVPGVGVGPIRLGMTRRQVRTSLGAPKYVYSYNPKYRGGLAYEDYPDYNLAFSSDRVDGRVAVIEVESPHFKTVDGLSTHSQFKSVKSRHPHLTVVRDDPYDLLAFSYNDRSQGIGFCFVCSQSGDPVKDQAIRPKSEQHPSAIGVYLRGHNWKRFYTSE